MAVQGPPLLALPVSLCFYEDRRGCPYPATGSGWMDPLPLDGPCLSTAGVPLEQVSRHTVVATDASSMDWGATCNRQAALGLWTGPPTDLIHQLPRAVGSASSLTAVPATVRQVCVNLHGQHCGCLVYQLSGRYTITPHVTARHAISNHCVLSTSRGSSIARPMCSHDSSRSPENGDSIPR